MGENEELQEEELEVLKSIYEGDGLYTNPDNKTHLYKFGEVGTLKTFILGKYNISTIFHNQMTNQTLLEEFELGVSGGVLVVGGRSISD